MSSPSPGGTSRSSGRRSARSSGHGRVAAEIATLPIALAAFGRFGLIAPLVNLFVVPLVAPAMAAGAIALVGGMATLLGLPSIIATVAGLPAWAVLTVIVGIVRIAAGI